MEAAQQDLSLDQEVASDRYLEAIEDLEREAAEIGRCEQLEPSLPPAWTTE